MTPGPPIADLSYRRYDGPLTARRFRWWIIAMAQARLAWRNRWYWVLVAGAFLPYVFYALVFYLWQSVAQQSPLGMAPPRPPMLIADAGGKAYAALFFQAFRGVELVWLFGIALLVGSGSIAGDHRANALQIYLSKPITRGDYLTGKWVGIFLPVALAALLPAVSVYGFLGAAFSSEGFFREEPTLILRIVASCLLPGALHASLLVGVSAWSSTARMAGAFHTGLYFLSGIVARILWAAAHGMDPAKGILLQHASAPGILQGLAQNFLGVVVERTLFRRHGGMPGAVEIPAPDAWTLAAAFAGLCLAGILAAWTRIRAVEVTHG